MIVINAAITFKTMAFILSRNIILILFLFVIQIRSQVPSLESLASQWQDRNETIGNMPTQTNFWGSATPSTDPDDALGLDVFDAFPFVGWLRTRLGALDSSGIEHIFAPNA